MIIDHQLQVERVCPTHRATLSEGSHVDLENSKMETATEKLEKVTKTH